MERATPEEEAGPVLVPPHVAQAVLERVRSGVYRDSDEVLTLALQLLEWGESDPVGKRQLLRFAIAAGDADAEAGRIISGEEVAREMRARVRALVREEPS